MPVHVHAGARPFEIELPAGSGPDREARVGGETLCVRLSPLGGDAFALTLGDATHVVTAERAHGRVVRVTVGSVPVPVHVQTAAEALLARFGLDAGADAAEREVRAPMPGLVLRVFVEAGDPVAAGQGVLVLEAMKMENELKAPAEGTVTAVHATPGQAVSKGDVLLELA